MGENQKGIVQLLLLLAVVFIAVVGLGYYAYQNGRLRKSTLQETKTSETVSDTSGWKTYTNNYLGYTINYPEVWEVHSIYPNDEYDDGEKVDINQTPYIYLMSKEMDSFINIEEQQYAHNRTTFEENAEFWKNYYLGSTSGFADARKQVGMENYKIDGRNAIKNTITYQFEDMQSPGTAVWTYISLPGTHLLSVKYTSENSNQEKLNLYNQILSTLRFIDNNSSNVSFFEVLNNPTQYSGKRICTEGYFYSAFEASAFINDFDEQTKQFPSEIKTWARNETDDNILETTKSMDRYGAVRKIKACGTFETEGNYGHLGRYYYQFNIDYFEPAGDTISL